MSTRVSELHVYVCVLVCIYVPSVPPEFLEMMIAQEHEQIVSYVIALMLLRPV